VRKGRAVRGARANPVVRDGPGRFDLLASAIAGRPLEVAATEPGGPAWTDGSTVFVDVETGPDHQLATVAAQSALIGAGSLDPEILRVLERRSALIRRYLAVEGHRALVAQEHLVPRRASRALDRAIAGRSGSPVDSLAIARSREPIGDPPGVFGTIRPRAHRARSQSAPHEDPAQQHNPRRGDEGIDELDSEAEEADAVVDVFSSPVGGGGGLGSWLRKLFGEGRSTEAGPSGADSVTRWTHRGDRAARTVAFSTSPAPLPEGLRPDARGGVTYPEWDAKRRCYRPGWCTVTEVEPAPDELAPFAPPDTGAFRRPLARLGVGLEPEHRRPQGDDIDVDAVVERQVQMRAESAPDEDVYIDTVRRRRDLSVLLLLDVSGSAGETAVTGEPVHEHQRRTAAALALVLHELGDRVALYGFRSQGRSAVHAVPVKRFGEDLDERAMQRLGGLVPGAYTRLGAAIRHAAAVLEREAGTPRRLLVVLSDGFAYDHGYERSYGEADSRRALAEARRLGIGTLCLSVGAATDTAALRRVFGVAAHAAVARTDDLPRLVGPLFRSALRSADLQRRTSQRRGRTKERLELERKAG
jgi:nitric oxide reductase NorD protein